MLTVVRNGRIPVRILNLNPLSPTKGRYQKLERPSQVNEVDVQGARDLSVRMDCTGGIKVAVGLMPSPWGQVCSFLQPRRISVAVCTRGLMRLQMEEAWRVSAPVLLLHVMKAAVRFRDASFSSGRYLFNTAALPITKAGALHLELGSPGATL
ncbi:unnamed protein product [Lota lota]